MGSKLRGYINKRLVSSWSKHLDVNSECPPLSEDKVIFYNMRFCPYAQRTALVLIAKDIPYQTVNVNLVSKPQWFLNKNPLGKVPTIQIKKKIFYESLPVCNYLDASYAGRMLNPQCTEMKARDGMLLAHLDLLIGSFYRILLSSSSSGDSDKKAEALKTFRRNASIIERELGSRGKDQSFLGGKRLPGMVDYMIWPWMERLEVASHLLGQAILPTSQFPLLSKWVDDMRKDETVKSYLLPNDLHLAFIQSFINKSPIYDPPTEESNNDFA